MLNDSIFQQQFIRPQTSLRYNSNNHLFRPYKLIQYQFILIDKLLNIPTFLTHAISVSPTPLRYRRMEGNNHFKNETSPELRHPVPSKIKAIHVLLMHTPLYTKSRASQHPSRHSNQIIRCLVCTGWHARWVC